MALLYQIALVKIKTFGHEQIGKRNQLLLGYQIPKEIGSYLDTKFQRKSAPTWIPNSKGNWLLLGYRIPKEIGSYLDTEFQRKSAPTWIPISKGNRLQRGHRYSR
ncbi:unnamed protein product [Rhizophagus irregularis]|nr:unnamed protein product [Rhizophagus irregularis]